MFYQHKTQLETKQYNIRDYILIGATLFSMSLPIAAQTADESASVLLKKIKQLETRIIDLESSTVLSDPETRVKKIQVYIDENGLEHDTPVPNSRAVTTYQRERVYRRQTINEKIGEALEDAASNQVRLGVDAAIILQNVNQPKGMNKKADRKFYQLASTDLYFSAGLAQYTIFFADIVGLSGTPPNNDIDGLTLMNGYSARLVNQNDLSLREAWVMSELWDQKLSFVMGRVDLTNYFDSNAAANDETSQFLSDALVNNPALGLSENGAGMALTYDPKSKFNFKIGYQQSSSKAKNLSDSLFLLAEAGYKTNLFQLGEGNYRVWYRQDNTGGNSTAQGLSFDQRVSPGMTLFARYGVTNNSNNQKNKYYSAGMQFDAGLGFNPQDIFGVGYAESRETGNKAEKLIESYYKLVLTEKLQLTFNITLLEEHRSTNVVDSYVISGMRLQSSF